MARPILVLKNTKELVRRAQAHARSGKYPGVTGLAVPHRKADREEFFKNPPKDNYKAVRQEFGIPFPLLNAIQQIAGDDPKTLNRIVKVFAAVGDGGRYSSVRANGILAKVERGTLDIEGLLAELKNVG